MVWKKLTLSYGWLARCLLTILVNIPFYSKKQSVYAKNGVVATSEGLAAQAGLEILKVYHQKIDVEFKKDNSPLTIADKKANDIIFPLLKSERINLN